MKNKKALYYAILPIAYFILSLTCVSITFVVLKIILDIYYRYNSQYGGTLIDAIKFFMLFKAQSGLDRNLNYVIIAICTFIVYYLFMRKTYVGLAKIVNATNQMAAGDLDKVIEIDCKGDTKKLGDNINIISSLLKDVTIQERKAQQTKADLITNVSHDLRTPLTSIKGYLGLINGDNYRDEVQLRYYVDIAYEKSKELEVLINDLFELTKVQNNSITLDKIDIDLVELLNQIIFQFGYQFESEKIKERSFFSEDKLIISADPNKLVRAFQNLINNGIKYGTGEFLDIYAYKKNDYAVVDVISYGNPIPAVELPYIFDKFYRVDKSRNKNDGGSGLGLAITKSIVSLHGGIITAQSDGEKTIFKVMLPLLKDKIKIKKES
ncbi:HAMP domain-containing sensor histidine kinase [uncultured Intestinibacter sp.]|uniref:sensor histidine kinase n=1 Tax=uncultured Intestinibacter sp. TaxID=1505659 RepID=UPI0027DD8BED|nr:HAMP domain-containing sensor histidine kinase [uncultured Intestinibacter sp.]